MTASLLTPTTIAREGLMQLDNNLVFAKLAYRDFEGEFGDTKVGDTITVRKPVKYNTRLGPVAQVQDAVEGKTTIQINKQRGVDLRFPSKDLTLTIDRFAERYLKQPMIALANQVDMDVAALWSTVWNYVTPAQVTPDPTKVIGGFKEMTPAFRRLDDMAVPTPRTGAVAPADYYGFANYLTTTFSPELIKDALTRSKIPVVGGSDIYASQNIGVDTAVGQPNTTAVSATGQTLAAVYDGSGSSVKDTNSFSLLTKNWNASTQLNVGNVFTITGVFAVNPVTKQALPYLQQFVINAPVTTNATPASDTAITFSPAPILTGPYQNVSAAPVANAVINWFAGVSGYTNVSQNLVFHQNAFALCMVPMELPEGAVKKARESYKGTSIRVICDYDIINDINMWRMDILYGVKSLYPDLATRVNGATVGT